MPTQTWKVPERCTAAGDGPVGPGRAGSGRDGTGPTPAPTRAPVTHPPGSRDPGPERSWEGGGVGAETGGKRMWARKEVVGT